MGNRWFGYRSLIIAGIFILALCGCQQKINVISTQSATANTSNNVQVGTNADFSALPSWSKEFVLTYNGNLYERYNVSVKPLESTRWLKSVSFINSKTGFLSLRYEDSENKPIGTDFMKTTDGGLNWASINKDADLYSLCFVNEKAGYAIENKGRGDERLPVLVKTTDGGIHWEQALFKGDKYPVEINCINENTIFIGASTETNGLMGGIFYETTICRSIDGGKNWDIIPLPGGFSGEGMSWISAAEGYILHGDQGGAGMQPKTLFYTKDGGKHWAIQAKTGGFGEKVDKISCFPLGGYGAGIKFFADGTGYIGESRGFICKTFNMGKTFKPVNYPEGTDCNPVPDFINKDEGYAIHANSHLIHTTNGGEDWEVIWPIK